jgi:hypothetical protein
LPASGYALKTQSDLSFSVLADTSDEVIALADINQEADIKSLLSEGHKKVPQLILDLAIT